MIIMAMEKATRLLHERNDLMKGEIATRQRIRELQEQRMEKEQELREMGIHFIEDDGM